MSVPWRVSWTSKKLPMKGMKTLKPQKRLRKRKLVFSSKVFKGEPSL